jgi:N-methylhydantoinase B
MPLDPVTLAVVHNAFKSIVNEMNLALFRSAYSPVITEGRDIGGAVFDAEGRLVAQGDWDLAVFVGLLEFSVQAILERYAGEIEPGDVFIMNDPFVGGTHFNDVGIARPVFDGSRLVGFVAVCGHWPDVGGQEPGSFVANAREHFQEGLRMPPIKLYLAGRPNRAVFDIIASNMRIPQDRLGDLRAQVGATMVGQNRLEELALRYGWGHIAAAMRETISYSERLLRSQIARFPDGVYEGEDFIDMESLDRRIPKRVHVRLSVEGDGMRFDFSGSDPESLSASNSTYSATASAVYVTTKSLFPDIPMNHGCFKPLEIIAPPGTVVNARAPRAISSMAATVYEKVIGSCLAALAQVVPERAVGCPYNLINLTVGGQYRGRVYVAYLYSEGGFGGRATKDGPPGLVSLYGGGAKITPVEVTERRYPIEFEEWALWPDSGGPGRYRGGVGSRKTFRLVEGEARLSCLGDREFYPPFGVLGGREAARQALLLNVGSPSEKDISLKAVGYPLTAGDRVTIVAAGGGGYGDPLERDPELVLQDVRKGYVTPERATSDYGVVLSPSNTVDREATARRRAGFKLLREARRRDR